jgi:hypothetical protein
MKLAGAVLTTAESALFDLMRSADHPNFKAISTLLRTSNDAEASSTAAEGGDTFNNDKNV